MWFGTSQPVSGQCIKPKMHRSVFSIPFSCLSVLQGFLREVCISLSFMKIYHDGKFLGINSFYFITFKQFPSEISLKADWLVIFWNLFIYDDISWSNSLSHVMPSVISSNSKHFTTDSLLNLFQIQLLICASYNRSDFWLLETSGKLKKQWWSYGFHSCALVYSWFTGDLIFNNTKLLRIVNASAKNSKNLHY